MLRDALVQELKTVLTGIFGAGRTLEDRWEELSAEECQLLARTVANQTRRLDGLIDELVAITTAEAAEPRAEPAPAVYGVVEEFFRAFGLDPDRDELTGLRCHVERDRLTSVELLFRHTIGETRVTVAVEIARPEITIGDPDHPAATWWGRGS